MRFLNGDDDDDDVLNAVKDRFAAATVSYVPDTAVHSHFLQCLGRLSFPHSVGPQYA